MHSKWTKQADKIKGHSAASNDKIAKSCQKMHGSGTTNEKRLQTNNKLPKLHVQNDASRSHESAHKSAADLINQEKKKHKSIYY